MAMDDVGPRGGPRLSEAASRTLDELVAQRRQQVIAEAISAARGQEITAADIVRAYYEVDEPAPYEVTETFRSTQPAALVMIATLFVFIALGAVFFSQLSQINEEQLFALPNIVAIIAVVMSFTAVLSTFILQYTSVRRSRQSQESLVKFTTHDDTPRNHDYRRQLARGGTEIQQRGLFLVKWAAVEEKLRELAIMHQPTKESQSLRFQPIGSLMANLKHAGVIGDELSSNIRKVVAVRNKVAHQEQVPHSQMLVGMEILDEVEQQLSSLIKK